ncbi:MAG: hypothetical protein Q7S55_03445 [Nanoarchaeota archaeon]|nr:hypothetical protein [Nanoarchaeota archaeon]
MISGSPVVSFQEGIDALARRIFTYTGTDPYIATIRGMSGIGKSHFGREVVGKLYFKKQGTLTKPHDLEREKQQKGTLDYVLLEIDQFDNSYDELIDLRTRNLCGKVPDYRIFIVRDLGRLLDEKLKLSRILSFFDLVVENKEHPDYR